MVMAYYFGDALRRPRRASGPCGERRHRTGGSSMWTRWLLMCASTLWMACAPAGGLELDIGVGTSADDVGQPRPDPNAIIPPRDQEGCHAIYAQDHLPTFELTIDPEEWAKLYDEWLNGQENEYLEEDGLID